MIELKLFLKSSQAIFGMAYERQHILDTAYRYSDRIQEHILKCIIYTKSYTDYNHWIDEISNWIVDVNNMKSKKGLKIKDKDYLKNLFSAFGDELSDAKREVELFHRKFVEKHPDPYPDFDITKKLYSTYFYAWQDLKDHLKNKIGKIDQATAKDEIKTIVHQVLDSYC